MTLWFSAGYSLSNREGAVINAAAGRWSGRIHLEDQLTLSELRSVIKADVTVAVTGLFTLASPPSF